MTNEPISPDLFLARLRTVNPQFNEKTQQGVYMQQDAEEFHSTIVQNLNQLPKLEGSDKNVYPLLFGGTLSTELTNKADATDKTVTSTPFNKLSCHISAQTNFLLDGLKTGLDETVSKKDAAGVEAQYSKKSVVETLPYYLNIQFVRFLWKSKAGVKAKIVRPVEFPMTLDVYDLCSTQLKEQLAPKRKRIMEIEDKKQAEEAKRKREEKDAKKDGKKEEPKEESKKEAPPVSLNPSDYVNDTGMYELVALVTHRGRDADSGHYVGWVKDHKGQWLRYDDDVVTAVNSEDEIKKLSGKGGADAHIAYFCLYKSKKIE